MQKINLFHEMQFESTMIRLAIPIFDHATPSQNIFDQFLILVNLYQYANNQFISSVHPSDTVTF